MAESKKGLHDAEARPAQIKPAPVERPYSEAVTDEHREQIRAAGVVMPELQTEK